MAYKITLKKKNTRPSYLTVTHKKTAQGYIAGFRKAYPNAKIKIKKVRR